MLSVNRLSDADLAAIAKKSEKEMKESRAELPGVLRAMVLGLVIGLIIQGALIWIM